MVESKWLDNYLLLIEFKEKYNGFPKQKDIYKGVRLGGWCAQQHREINKGNYPADRLQKLESIGFLESNIRDEHWETCFLSLQKFLDEFGRFPIEPEIYDGFNIGKWCNNQKTLSKCPSYSKNRYDKLNRIGFFDNTRDARWEQHYQLLCDFVNTFHRMPKRTDVYQDFRIGSWCTEQKRRAKLKQHPSYRIEKLRAIELLNHDSKPLVKEENY